MGQKFQSTGGAAVGKKKHFGAQEESKKENKDFIASEELKPEMKLNGFIVNQYLSKVARMIQDKGYDCMIVDTDGESIAHLAVQENRVMLTDNLKLFNKKITIPRGCLHFKAKPLCKFSTLKA